MKQARHARGLSQRELAHQVGIAPSTLSRYESGAKLPSLPLLDRVLAACGKDLHLTVVERHADLDAELARLEAQSIERRTPDDGLYLPTLLTRIAAMPSPVLVAGRWAALLHGLPTEPGDGRLLVPDDEATVEALAALLASRYAQIEEDGYFCGLQVRPSTLYRHRRSRWYLMDVGTLVIELRSAAEPPPAAQELATPRGVLQVAPAESLTPADCVAPDVLDRWRTWRAGRPLRPVRWEWSCYGP